MLDSNSALRLRTATLGKISACLIALSVIVPEVLYLQCDVDQRVAREWYRQVLGSSSNSKPLFRRNPSTPGSSMFQMRRFSRRSSILGWMFLLPSQEFLAPSLYWQFL